MSLQFLDIANMLVQDAVHSLFIINIIKSKYSKKISFLILFLAQFICYLLTYSIRDILYIKTPVFALFFLTALFYISENTRKEIIIIFVSFLLLMFLSEFLSLVIYGIFTHYNYNEVIDITVTRVIAAIFYSILFLAASMMYSIFWKGIKGVVRRRLLMLLVLLPLSQIILLLGIYHNNYGEISNNVLLYGLLYLIVSLSADYLMYQAFNQAVATVENERELEYIKRQNELQYNYYQLAAEGAKEIRVLKHEISNQLQTAYALFNQGNPEKDIADNLIKAIQEKTRVVNEIIYCKNPVVNSILAIKTAQAKERGIDTNIEIGEIDDLLIEDIDLCSIFSNLFDNSIEACLNINSLQTEIRIKAGIRLGYFVVRCGNTFNNHINVNENQELLTTKEDSKQHGYGIKLIKAIAKKYDGEVTISCPADWFEIRVSLKQKN